MKSFARFALVPSFIVTALSLTPRSDMVGLYATIDKVAISPNAENPVTIQIWGTFTISENKAGDHYGPPTKGYLYLTMPPGDNKAVRAEWSDLAKVAGTHKMVGFTQKYAKTGSPRVRCNAEAATNPDLYTTPGIGVVLTTQWSNTADAEIKAKVVDSKAVEAACKK